MGRQGRQAPRGRGAPGRPYGLSRAAHPAASPRWCAVGQGGRRRTCVSCRRLFVLHSRISSTGQQITHYPRTRLSGDRLASHIIQIVVLFAIVYTTRRHSINRWECKKEVVGDGGRQGNRAGLFFYESIAQVALPFACTCVCVCVCACVWCAVMCAGGGDGTPRVPRGDVLCLPRVLKAPGCVPVVHDYPLFFMPLAMPLTATMRQSSSVARPSSASCPGAPAAAAAAACAVS